MKLEKRILAIIIVVLAVFVFTGCCSHDWEEATCTTPKTCKQCGEIEGDAKHNFATAECMEERVCKDCGTVKEPSGHKWKKANCTEPKTCKKCGEIEGVKKGHSTRYGECTMCGEYIEAVEFKDDFAVVTISDTSWMQDEDDFVDVYVIGTILEISKYNEFLIEDSEKGKWTVDVGTGRDFSAYIGTECMIYGFSTGVVSEIHKTPLINMNHDNNRIVFIDSRTLYPQDFDSEKQFESKFSGNIATETSGKVWIPTDGGNKYHGKATCSGMYNPELVSSDVAIAKGLSKCGRCW